MPEGGKLTIQANKKANPNKRITEIGGYSLFRATVAKDHLWQQQRVSENTLAKS
jgi:hypothetical protein